MKYSFLTNNRDELIGRCKSKVSKRPKRQATAEQLQNGIPLFLDQLARTLQDEELGEDEASLLISGPAGGTAHAQTEMGVSAAAHGKALLGLGFTVDQVVHDYGDLCQAITDLAEVADCCGGLPAGSPEKMFTPFFQRSEDRSGMGLGLSIARRAVEADGGTLSARDLPGRGCVFTISLPRDTLHKDDDR